MGRVIGRLALAGICAAFLSCSRDGYRDERLSEEQVAGMRARLEQYERAVVGPELGRLPVSAPGF
jgi:hypothetical protein